MKKKVVRDAYIASCESVQRYIRFYGRHIILFSEMLESVGEQLRNEHCRLLTLVNKGTITDDERQLIEERLEAYTKREIKNACKA